MINFTEEDLNQAHAAGAQRIDIEVRGAEGSSCCKVIYFSKRTVSTTV